MSELTVTTIGETVVDMARVTSTHHNYGVQNRFNEIYESTTREVICQPMWHTGTGYMNGIVRDKQLRDLVKTGEVARTQDVHGRKMILIGTRFGICVVFQRYSNQPHHRHIVHVPEPMVRFRLVQKGSGRPVDENTMDELFGYGRDYNIGCRIEDFARFLNTGLYPNGMLPPGEADFGA